jgi:prevent-host-death family protein
MREIDVRDAERSFDALLDLVERGEEIIITRNGSEVGRLVPTIVEKTGVNPEEARAAIQRIRERAREAKLGITLEETLQWRDEGRR